MTPINPRYWQSALKQLQRGVDIHGRPDGRMTLRLLTAQEEYDRDWQEGGAALAIQRWQARRGPHWLHVKEGAHG